MGPAPVSQNPDRRTRLVDVLLARRSVRGARAVVGQLVLESLLYVIAGYATGVIYEIQVPRADRFWYAVGVPSTTVMDGEIHLLPSLPDDPKDVAAIFCAVVAGTMLLVFLAYECFRFFVRIRPVDVALFARNAYRAALLAFVAAPLVAYVLSLAPPNLGLQGLDGCLFLFYVIAGPPIFARREVRRGRMARWRPQCPECGYSLKRLGGDVCPECGTQAPTPVRTYRRWAMRRLTWDRLARGSFPVAYVKSLTAIVFRPAYAARRLAMPDRLGRATRWAAFHVVLFSLLSLRMGPRWIATHIELAFMKEPYFYDDRLSGWLVTRWSFETFIAWLLVVGALPAVGVLLAWAVPGAHPAARVGRIKWSLYLTAGLLLVLLVYGAVQFTLIAGFARTSFPGASVLSSLFAVNPPPWDLMAFVYGVWWAIGMASNPYGRRGMGAFSISALVFAATAALLALVVLPLGPLVPMLW